MRICITGCAGFIGSHVARRLLNEGHFIVGLDNLNDYYDVSLKEDRLKLLQSDSFIFFRGNLEDRELLHQAFDCCRPDIVIHLAAQAGVRYSLENPHVYIESNIVGFMNILEECRKFEVEHLLYASSSSVYGLNKNMPYSVNDPVDHPISIYAATKKANELLAFTYSHLYDLPTTGLRFFTVYGPWGRPDMAMSLFTKAIVEGNPIRVYNQGNMKRDFTYIDDIVEGIVRLIPLKPSASPTPYKVYNIGSQNPVNLLTFIQEIEEKLGMTGTKHFMPLQPGDVPETYADVSDLMRDTGFRPITPIREGVGKFIDWYKAYYGL